jgi:dihydrofolate synthase/folylpolyglutamate synthase
LSFHEDLHFIRQGLILTYRQAVQYLFRRSAEGIKLGLDQIQALMERLDHPEQKFHSIHIAGTNGKGSTAAMLESILREAGYRTGLYTSPHLVDMRERILVRGKPLSKKAVTDRVQFLKPHADAANASFFEILTALAFLHFADNNIDVAVLETGLGGRLDATNVVRPILTILTEIGMDHTNILGKNLRTIAGEKAGILKPGVQCISGAKKSAVKGTLSRMAEEKRAPIRFLKDEVRIKNIRLTEKGCWFDYRSDQSEYNHLYLRLAGEHQIENGALALMAVDELRKIGWSIPEKAVRQGLARVAWKARLQILQRNPTLLIDSAHNPLGMDSLVRALTSIFKYDRLVLVFGVLKDKAYQAMSRKIVPLADEIVLTKPLSDRALDPEILSRLPVFNGKSVRVIPDIPAAWNYAVSQARTNDLVCGCGSIFFVGEVLRVWGRKKKSQTFNQ